MATDEDKTKEISALLEEGRQFSPPGSFRETAWVNDESVYREADADPEGFWARMASELEWHEPWNQVMEWKPPHAKWFVGGKLNVSVNCLDRHLRNWRRNKAAIIWEVQSRSLPPSPVFSVTSSNVTPSTLR